jgi:protein-S-isoprenylcysteine O-methyltransferase Ste14
MSRPPEISHIFSILALPFNVIVTAPVIISVLDKNSKFGWGLSPAFKIALFIAGGVLIVAGMCLLIITIGMFIRIGKGTLAPWNPTRKLVVTGPYRYVRNPMISGVIFILIGETMIIGSVYLVVMAGVFFAVNHLYFIFVEEPGLIKRFGEEYRVYKKNVGRWLPRFTPWEK